MPGLIIWEPFGNDDPEKPISPTWRRQPKSIAPHHSIYRLFFLELRNTVSNVLNAASIQLLTFQVPSRVWPRGMPISVKRAKATSEDVKWTQRTAYLRIQRFRNHQRLKYILKGAMRCSNLASARAIASPKFGPCASSKRLPGSLSESSPSLTTSTTPSSFSASARTARSTSFQNKAFASFHSPLVFVRCSLVNA